MAVDMPVDMMQAVLGGHHVSLGRLFEAGVSLLEPDAQGGTMLAWHVQQESPKQVRALLSLTNPLIYGMTIAKQKCTRL